MRSFLLVCMIILFGMGCSLFRKDKISSNEFYEHAFMLDMEKRKRTKELDRYDHSTSAIRYFQQKGYVVIGHSAVRDTYIGIDKAIEAGKALGAEVMLYLHKHVGVPVSGRRSLPFDLNADIDTINRNYAGELQRSGFGYANNSGSGGYLYGGAYKTLNSSNDTVGDHFRPRVTYAGVPLSLDYYDQYAVFLVKRYHWFKADAHLLDAPSPKARKMITIPAYRYFILKKPADRKKRYHKVIFEDKEGYIKDSLPLF